MAIMDVVHVLLILGAMVSIAETAGGWSKWTAWFGCTRTCGIGMQLRERKCDQPVPTSPSENCIGATHETQACNTYACPAPEIVRDGGWGTWAAWHKCSVSCGGGVRLRDRKCDNPEPNHRGRGCVGAYNEFAVCGSDVCPVAVTGGWSPWATWLKCTVTCDGGAQIRARKCDSPPPGPGMYCVGEQKEIRECNTAKCPNPATCPVGWTKYNTDCYRFSVCRLTRECTVEKSREKCGEDGATLVSVGDRADQTFIHSLKDSQTLAVLAGGTDEANEGVWVWGNGDPFTYTQWDKGQPKGGRTNNCMVLWQQYVTDQEFLWLTYSCQKEFVAAETGYVCQKPL